MEKSTIQQKQQRGLISIDSPEMCGTCFTHITRDGKNVVCACGVIGITSASYETTWKPELKTNRGHNRGHARGGHRGESR